MIVARCSWPSLEAASVKDQTPPTRTVEPRRATKLTCQGYIKFPCLLEIVNAASVRRSDYELRPFQPTLSSV